MKTITDRAGALDEAIKKYGAGEGALIPVLQAVQAEEGYLSEEALTEVAHRLRLPVSRVYGVATFYSQFRLQKCGEHTIRICHGTACHVAGAGALTEAFKEYLKIDVGETTADGQFTLEAVACLGCCSLAPAVMIDDNTHGRLTPDSVKQVMKQYERNE